MAATLIGAVFVAVHHAEVVAHRVGEPFGTLILALSVLVALTTLTLILPTLTIATPGPTFLP